MKTVIRSEADLEAFLASDAHKNILKFLEHLCASIEGFKTGNIIGNTLSKKIEGILEKWLLMIKTDFSPVKTASRFGNPAFRSWLDCIQTQALPELKKTGLFDSFSGENDETLIKEAASYLSNSFGNWQRIDYGTGHELHFLAFLYILYLSTINKDKPLKDSLINLHQPLVKISLKYFDLCRQLQLTYWLEPAGSQGVWGLDDYHFIPFPFGASQLATHDHLRPSSIHDRELVKELRSQYIYFAAIDDIFCSKTSFPDRNTKLISSKELLRRYSPLLNDISGAKSWRKVQAGLLRMYGELSWGNSPLCSIFCLVHL